MLRNCNVCPDLESLKPFILQVLINNYYSDIIKFRECISIDICELIIQHAEISDYIDKIVLKLNYIKSHYFIIKSKSSYLSNKRKFKQ